MARPKKTTEQKYDNLPKCDCCKKPILDTPFRIDIEQFTHVAQWHRNTKNVKFQLCNVCSMMLSDSIDDTLLKLGAERKEWYPDSQKKGRKNG